MCDGFIGNRMIEQYCAPGRLPARGRLHAAAGRQGDREVRLRHGPVPHGRPGRQRHRLGHPQAPLRREARTCATARPPTCCARLGRFGQKTGAGWYDYEPGKRDAIPSQVVDEMIEKHSQGARHQRRARSATRRSCSAWCTRWSTKARSILEEGIASARQRHRHGLPHRLRLPAVPRRPDVLCRHGGPVQRGAGDEALRRQPARRRRVLAAGAAAGQARRRRQDASTDDHSAPWHSPLHSKETRP